MYKLSLVLLLVSVPAFADADPAKQLAKDLDIHLSYWSTYRDDPGSRAEMLDRDPTPAECDAAIAKARKAGLKDDAKIISTRFNGWDEASYTENKEAYVALTSLERMCQKWHKMVLLSPAAAIQTQTASSLYVYSLSAKDGAGSFSKDMGQSLADSGKKCIEVTDAAIKAGAPGDHKVKIKDDVMTITEGKTKVCQAMIDFGNSLDGKIKEAHAADREKRAAPYKALGVAGAKLELFLEYDDVYWRGGKDCQRIYEIKALAKAKALFQWLENPDGTHTIRKYTFNGNKVSGPTNKTFKTAGAAQRACK